VWIAVFWITAYLGAMVPLSRLYWRFLNRRGGPGAAYAWPAAGRLVSYLTSLAMLAGSVAMLADAIVGTPTGAESLQHGPAYVWLLDGLFGHSLGSGLVAVVGAPVSNVGLRVLLETNGRDRHGLGGPVTGLVRWPAVLLAGGALLCLGRVAVALLSEDEAIAIGFTSLSGLCVVASVFAYGLALVPSQASGVSASSWRWIKNSLPEFPR
jgi:ethanolamine transporter EutH